MANLIKASTLTGRKDPTKEMLKAMIVRGGRQAVREWLAACKYTGDSPTAVPIFTLDQESPRIKAARWHLQGAMDREIGINAKDLFTGAGPEKIFIKIEDLDIFTFTAEQDGGENVSAWVESSSLAVRWTDTGAALDSEEVAKRGLDKFCVRACIQPESVTGALLWLAAIPLSKDELLATRNEDFKTRRCPQIHLGIGP